MVRPITLGDWVEVDGANLWLVESGLKGGDTVIVDGIAKLQPGGAIALGGPPPGAPGAGHGAREGCAAGQGRREGAVAQVLSAGRQHVFTLLHRPPDLRGGHLGVLRARGPRRDALAADRPVSRNRAAGRHRDGGLSGRFGRGAGADRRRAARERDQRRAEHALHGVALDRRGRDPDHGHLRDRHQRRRRGDQRQQPRQAGRAAPAARGAPAGRGGRARLLVFPAGARVLLAGRPLRRSLHFELRDAERAGRAEAPARHDQRPDLRRERLRDADLAEARPPCPAQADARRRRGGRQRAERAVRRRQDRPDADRRQAGPGLHDHDPRPARGPEGIRPDHRARQSRRLDGAPCRRRARGARREGLRLHRPLQRPPGHPRRHLPRAGGQRARGREDRATAAPRRSRRSFPRASPTPFRTTRRTSSKCRSGKWSRPWPRPCCWCSSSSTCFCKAGAPR